MGGQLGWMACLVPWIAFAAGPEGPTPALLKRANAMLDQALVSQDLPERGDGLAALGVSHRADALEKLTAALVEDQGKVRFAAAQGLRLLGDPKAAPAIVDAWRTEKGWAVKKEISLAAGACGARDLLGELRAAYLYEKEPDVRAAIAFALEDLGDVDAKVQLAGLGNPQRKGVAKPGTDSWSRHVLTGEKEGDVRLAVRTLAQIGGRQDLPLLEKALVGLDRSTRLWAAAGIVRLSRPSGL